MKKYLLIFFLSLNCFCKAQTPPVTQINYSYDNVGNRVYRHYQLFRIADPNAPKDLSESVEKKYGISVFPNPTSNELNVSILLLPQGDKATFYLSNEQGQNLILQQQNSPKGAIELSNFKAGIYYLKIIINDDNVSYKVVKI